MARKKSDNDVPSDVTEPVDGVPMEDASSMAAEDAKEDAQAESEAKTEGKTDEELAALYIENVNHAVNRIKHWTGKAESLLNSRKYELTEVQRKKVMDAIRLTETSFETRVLAKAEKESEFSL